jgi:biotin carboxylase
MYSPILLVINVVTPSTIKSVEKLRSIDYLKQLKIVCLTRNDDSENNKDVTTIKVDFDNDASIKHALEQIKGEIAGIVCRGDGNIQYLRKLVRHLPPSVLVASEESLAIATNKRFMRQVFKEKCPELSPAFVQVDGAEDRDLLMVEQNLKYPVIVKPANLMSSMLIQSCDNREELTKALKETFDQINIIYEREGRLETPQVIVEEFLEGDFYSVDAYIGDAGEVYCCPIVGYVPAKQLGIEDFYLYKRFIPTTLSMEAERAAYLASEKVVEAIGLAHSSAHIELILTKSGWKIIEIGPRIGRFRNRMYKLSYGIDHSTNDVLIHLGLQPEIPKELTAYTSCYSIYPDREGRLVEITGFEEAKQLDAVTHIDQMSKVGQSCKQAKHGGKALAEITISSRNKQNYEDAVKFVEANVRAVVRPE